MSQWLYAAMREAGLAVELLETRHVRKAFEAMPVKSDRNDARGIAQLMRLGWFRPVHCKSRQCAGDAGAADARGKLLKDQAARCRDEPARDTARLWAEGRQGHAPEREFAARIEELVASHPVLAAMAEAMLSVREGLRQRALRAFERGCGGWRARHAGAAADDRRPAVGPVTALTYVAARGRSGQVPIVAELAGAYFGLTPEDAPVG